MFIFFIVYSGDSRIPKLGHLRPCSPARVTREHCLSYQVTAVSEVQICDLVARNQALHH